VGALTGVSEVFKTLKDDLGFWSLLCFLVPALFGNLPDCRGNPRSFKASRLRRSLPLHNHDGDTVVRIFRKRHPPGRKLEGEII